MAISKKTNTAPASNVQFTGESIANMFAAVASEQIGNAVFRLVAALAMMMRAEYVGESGDKLESPVIASVSNMIDTHAKAHGLSPEYGRFLKSCAVSFVRLHRACLADTFEATLQALADRAGVAVDKCGTGTLQALREGKSVKAHNAARRERTAKAKETREANEKAERTGLKMGADESPESKAQKAMDFALRLAEAGNVDMLQAAARTLAGIIAAKLAKAKRTAPKAKRTAQTKAKAA